MKEILLRKDISHDYFQNERKSGKLYDRECS
jgi:hypothetical protein